MSKLIDVDNIVSIKTASQMLDVSRTEIYRLLQQGFLSQVLIDGKSMVDKTSVITYKSNRAKILAIQGTMRVSSSVA